MADSAIIRALKQVERNLKRTKQRFQNAMRGQAGRAANRALQSLTTEPGPPVYPLRWQSERQRRAFFATNGFGKGVPYDRQGDLLEGWEAVFEKTDEGGVLSLINPADAVQFVQGRSAQKFHLDTGWVQINDVQDDFHRDTEDVIVEVWYEGADPLEGV